MENSDFQFEGSYFVGVVLSAILFGVYLGIYYLSLCAILENINMTHSRRMFYISYSTTLLLLNMLFFPTPLLLGQKMWVEYRGYLGGPLEYYLSQFTNANYMIMGNIAQNLAIFLADALLITRRDNSSFVCYWYSRSLDGNHTPRPRSKGSNLSGRQS